MARSVALYHLRRNTATSVAAAVIVLLFLLAIFGPLIVPYDPLATSMQEVLQPPSADHWFGTDRTS